MEAVNMSWQAVVDYLVPPQFIADIEEMLNMPYPVPPISIVYWEAMRNNLYLKMIQNFKFYINNHFLQARPENAEILNQFAASMEEMLDLLYLETNPLHPEYGPLHGENMLSWIIALSSEFAQDYWTELQNFVNEERLKHPDNIFPPEAEVFTWMKYCRLDQIKVVIIGQDPYPDPGKAHGLCFSVKKPEGQFPIQKKSRSLNKIFKELERDPDIEDFEIPDHGDLTNWAEQGVLLLNAVLTVRSGKAGSHENAGWEIFTNRVVSLISERNPGVVFLLWGGYAKQKRPLIDERLVPRTAPHPNADPTEEDYTEIPKLEPKHLVLTARHPRARKKKKSADIDLFGSGHFSKTNAWLALRHPPMIDWQI